MAQHCEARGSGQLMRCDELCEVHLVVMVGGYRAGAGRWASLGDKRVEVGPGVTRHKRRAVLYYHHSQARSCTVGYSLPHDEDMISETKEWKKTSELSFSNIYSRN